MTTDHLWKRVLDVSGCLVALPVLGACTLVVGLITKLTSPGPIFFRQERVGRFDRRFQIYKFRTMHVGAETNSHRQHFADLVRQNAPMQKMDGRGDPRLITGGWLLRASGIDELPQIINVLQGDMSLVGPRPCIPYEYEQYNARQRLRFTSHPGLTGLWQVSGKNRTTFERMIELDIRYSETKSLLLDIWIITWTVPALLKQIIDTRRQRKDGARAGSGCTSTRSKSSSLELKPNTPVETIPAFPAKT